MTDDLDDFFNEIEEDIVETQKEIAHFAMENLFQFSPHYIPFNFQEEETDKSVQKIISNQDLSPEEKAEKIQQLMIDRNAGVEKISRYKSFGKDYIRSMYSYSEYDANHKVYSNKIPQGSFTLPTINRFVSQSIHEQESSKIDNINEIGDTITIQNLSNHADAVENGEGWKRAPAYSPYSKTEQLIDMKYFNDIEKK